jgi:glycosyltransferase involved in cell wall biosynthesis
VFEIVTIVTPSYQCAKYVGQTVDSILRQDYPAIRHIVLDDGSTDNTQEILQPYCPRIELYRHENMGEARTVNKGLAMVKSKYFMVLNADDLLYPSAVSILVEFMESHPDIMVGYPSWDMINENGAFKQHIEVHPYSLSYMLKRHACLPSVGTIFQSCLLEYAPGRDVSYRFVGDFEYLLRIGLVAEMAKVPYTLAMWRDRDGQLTKEKGSKQALEHIRLIQEFYALPVLQNELKVKNEAMCWAYMTAGLLAGSRTETLRYYASAIKSYPLILCSPSACYAVLKRIGVLA